MASGFIKINNNNTFAPRWTGYDEILKLVCRELKLIPPLDENIRIANWVQKHFPKEDQQNENDPGWAFIQNETNELINREIDLTILAPLEIESFWKATVIAYNKLIMIGDQYSKLNSEFMKDFIILKNK